MHTKFWCEKPDSKRPLGRRSPIWKDNIKMDFMEVSWKDVEWMHLAEDREHLRALVIKIIKF